MKKGLKIAGITLATILVLMFFVPMLLCGHIGQIVKDQANKMVNAKVEFTDLDISLFRHFPKASLELNDVCVTNIAPFEGDTLVAAKRIEVAVDLWSIFGDSFKVSKVYVKKPYINAKVNEEGKANWDIMPESEPAEQVEESNEPSSFKLSLNGLNIEDGSISYNDAKTKMSFHTAPLNISLKGDMSADNAELKLGMGAEDLTFILDKTKFASGLNATLEAVVSANMAQNFYTLSTCTLSVNSVRAAVTGTVQLGEKAIDTDLKLDCADNDFKNILSLVPAIFTKDFKNLTAKGDVSLTGFVKGKLEGDNLPTFAINLDVANGEFKYADLPKAVSNIAIKAGVANEGGILDKTVVNLENLSAQMAGQTFKCSLKASTPISNLHFDATAVGKIDLGAIKDIYPLGEDMTLGGIIIADAAASGAMSNIDAGEYDKMQVSGKIGVENMQATIKGLPQISINSALATISPRTAALEKFDIKVGNSDLRANGSLNNYWGYLLHNTTLTGTLSVNSSLLDLNEIMGSNNSEQESTKEESPKPETTQSSSAAEQLSAIEIPKNLNLMLNSSFEKVLFQKMIIDNLVGKITLKEGTLSLDKLAMDLFEGKANMSATYSTAKNPSNPDVVMDATFSGAKFATTVKQLDVIKGIAPIFESIDGTYSMSLNAALKLNNNMEPDLKSINGHGKLTTGNISLSKVKALEAISKAMSNSPLSTMQTSEATVISFTIENGNIITKPFNVKLGNTTLTLGGLTGLDQSIDYAVDVAITGGIKLSGKIGGTFSKPKVKLDAAKMVENALSAVGITKEVVDQKKAEAKEKLIAEAEKAGQKLVDAAKAEKEKLVAKASSKLGKIAAEKAGDKMIENAEKQKAKLIENASK